MADAARAFARRDAPPHERDRLVTTLFVAIYAALGLRLVVLGNLNHDEGYYLYAARLVWEGHVPYRDFALFQAPLMPYLYGLPQLLTGGSLLAGRLTSFVLGLAALLLAGGYARRLGGPFAGRVTMALLCAMSTFVWVYSTTRMEPLVVLLAVASLALLEKRTPLAEALAVSAAVWGAAVRISCLPAALLVLGIAVYRNRRSFRRWGVLVLAAATQLGLLLGLPLAAAGERMVFDVLGAQMLRHQQFGTGRESGLGGSILANSGAVLDHVTRLYPGVMAGGLLLAVLAWLSLRRRALRGLEARHAVPLAVAVALYLPQLTVQYVGEVYLLASAVILAVLVGCGLARLAETRIEGSGAPSTDHRLDTVVPSPSGAVPAPVGRSSGDRAGISGRSLATALAVILVALQAGSCLHDTQWRVSHARRPLARLSRVAERVAGMVGTGEQIVTFNTYLAVEAGRRVAPGFEPSWFSFYPALTTGEARSRGVVNLDLVREAVRDPRTACVLLTDFDVRLLAQAGGLDLPPWRPLNERQIVRVLEELDRRFTLVETVAEFGQWEDNLYILKR